jgi:hypothetical protein
MNPLDSTAIPERTAQSLFRPSAGPAAMRPAEPDGSARTPSRLFAVRPRSSASAEAAMNNPRAMIARAQQVMDLASMAGATDAFRRQIAVAAYLAEMEAQREMAQLQREALVAREWSA